MSFLAHLYKKSNQHFPKATAFFIAHGPSIALVAGFLWDTLTLSRVDALYDNIILFAYLVIASGSIFLINIAHAGRFTKVAPWLPHTAQFAFGGLFSSYIVYFSRSGEWFSSWPFLLVLGVLIFGNEMLKTRYQNFVFHTGVLFVAVFTFLIFYLPVLTTTMGAGTFIISGLCALLFTALFMYSVYRIAPVRVMGAISSTAALIGGLYVSFHALYFANVIPPLPLSLTEASAFYSVKKLPNGNYEVEQEFTQPTWYQMIMPHFRKIFSISAGESIYFYSAVFAPSKLSTEVFHRWERYDEQNKEWVFSGRIGFPITGGRELGYRGYSYKDAPSEGLWRVSVETERGVVIGRREFILTVNEGSFERVKQFR